MPICAEICRAEINVIFGTVTERGFRKKSKTWEHILYMIYVYDKMMQRYALNFFPQSALGDGPAFWIFSRIHG